MFKISLKYLGGLTVYDLFDNPSYINNLMINFKKFIGCSIVGNFSDRCTWKPRKSGTVRRTSYTPVHPAVGFRRCSLKSILFSSVKKTKQTNKQPPSPKKPNTITSFGSPQFFLEFFGNRAFWFRKVFVIQRLLI